MKHKLVRADGTTVLALKSFTFTEQVNQEGVLRFGSCIASCIDCVVFGTQANAVVEGEVLTYYQVFDYNTSFEYITTPREVLIGYFKARTIITEPDNYRIIAYDNNLDKVEGNYAAYLRGLSTSPFDSTTNTLPNLLANAANFAGISISSAITGVTPADHWKRWNFNIGANGIEGAEKLSVRDLLSYVAEIAGYGIKLWNGKTVSFFSYGSGSYFAPNTSNYIISPTDTETYYSTINPSVTLTPAFYKQGGLSYKDAYDYCPNYVRIFKTDGTLVGEYDGRSGSEAAIYYDITNNPVVDWIIGIDGTYFVNNGVYVAPGNEWNAEASNILYRLQSTYPSGGLRSVTADLFTFRNPYRAGNSAEVIDTNGVRFKFPVMKCEITDSVVTLTCFGSNDGVISNLGDATLEQTSANQGNQLVSLQSGFYTSAQSIDGTYYAFGFITGGRQSAYIVAQLPKVVLPESLVQIASLQCAMRVVGGGYIGNAENVNVTANISSASVFGTTLLILITNTSGWTYGTGGTSSGSVVNNTPICGRVTVQGAIYYGTGGATT